MTTINEWISAHTQPTDDDETECAVSLGELREWARREREYAQMDHFQQACQNALRALGDKEDPWGSMEDAEAYLLEALDRHAMETAPRLELHIAADVTSEQLQGLLENLRGELRRIGRGDLVVSPAADEQDELRELADDLLEDAMELRGWWEDWKKDEPRRGYAEEYRALCQRIDRGLRLLRPEMAERDES